MKKNNYWEISFCLYVLFSLVSADVKSQVDLYDTKNNNFISEDSVGNIWISGEKNWNKFNGASTTVLKSSDYKGFDGNLIQSSVFSDKYNTLWFSTYGKIVNYDPKSDKFYSFQLSISDDTLKDNYHVFYIDKIRDELYLTAHSYIIVYDIAKRTIKASLFDQRGSRRFAVQKLNGNSLIFGFPWLNGKGISFVKYENDQLNLADDFIDNGLTEYQIRDGLIVEKKLWLLTKSLLLEIDLTNGEIIQKLKPELDNWNPQHFCTYKSGLLITARNAGLWYFNINNRRFEYKWTENDGLLTNSPLDIFCDSRGLIWMNYMEKGVAKMSTSSLKSITKIDVNFGKIKELFAYENRIIVVSSDYGFFVLNAKGELIDRNELKPYSNIKDAIFSDRGTLLFVTDHQCVELDIFTMKSKLLLEDKDVNFHFINPLSKSKFAITSSKGLFMKNEHSIDLNSIDICQTDEIIRIIDLKENHILIAGNSDILECSGKTLINIGNVGFPSQIQRLANDDVYISSTDGLFRISNNKITEIIHSDPSTPKVHGFSFDDNDGIWMQTSAGIYYKDRRDVVSRLPIHGNDNFIKSSPIFAVNKVWFATNSGLVSVHKNGPKEYQETPHTYVMEVHINGLKYDSPLNPDYIEDMKLTWVENDLNFRTEVGEFNGDNHQSIKYRLDGLEKEWNYSKEFNLSYKNLQPGNYTLQMVGIGSNLRESEIKEIDIEISAPFYQTLWFRGSIAGALIFIGFGINYYRTKQKLRDQEIVIEKQKALQNQRNRMARDLHDEMGSGLTTIKYISNELKKERESDKIDQIEKTSTNLIGSMRDMLWSLDETNDTIGNLISKSRTVLHQMCRGTDIKYVISTDVKSEIGIPGIYRRNIILIFKEAITNVVKHAEATQLNIQFKADRESLQLSISDNGRGITENFKKEKSYGLNSIESRVKEMNGSLEVKSSDSGTNLEITIPLISS